MGNDAIILVGGKGTRLASVIRDLPKPMAKLDDGRPFVDVIVARLRAQGIARIIMATGHLADHIHEYYKDDSNVVCVREETPLGTGGAILNAMAAVPDLSETFFVLNGDSVYPFDLRDFHGGRAMIGVVDMPDSGRYGTVQIDADNSITAFIEKTGLSEAGLVSAGVYCFNKSVFAGEAIRPCSIEQDIFPELVCENMLIAVKNQGPMLDIGLPETYAAVNQFLTDSNL